MDYNEPNLKRHEAANTNRLDIPYHSSRRPIQVCTEGEWMDDYCKFYSSHMGKRLTPDNWPDSVLNGEVLDVFHLYKEVVQRGGFL